MPPLVAIAGAVAAAGGCGPVTSDMPAPPAYDSGANSTTGGGSSSGGGGSGDAATTPTFDASACAPADVHTFQPAAYVPAARPESACGPSEISVLYDSCFGPKATVTSCDVFRAGYPDCYACVLTPRSAATYGPIIDYASFVESNVAGCAELVSHGVLACAKPVQAVGGCQLAACEANCPVSDATTLASFSSCAAAAQMGGCQAYAQAASCLSVDSGPLAVCDPSDFRAFYFAVVPLFCEAADAGGAPSPRDAASE